MKYVTETHRTDDLGRPAGGETHGLGINIFWQDGPLRVAANDDGHTGECRWLASDCDYRETHCYCPHPEHACDCDGGRREPNGAFVEGVIEAAIGRLRFYQHSAFAGRENALALTKLEEALHWLNERTRAREERCVEGTHAL